MLSLTCILICDKIFSCFPCADTEQGSSSSEDLNAILSTPKSSPEENQPLQNGLSMVTNNTDMPFNTSSPQKIDPRLILLKYIEDNDWLALQEYLNHQSGTINVNHPVQNGNTIGHIVAEKGQLGNISL